MISHLITLDLDINDTNFNMVLSFTILDHHYSLCLGSFHFVFKGDAVGDLELLSALCSHYSNAVKSSPGENPSFKVLAGILRYLLWIWKALW